MKFNVIPISGVRASFLAGVACLMAPSIFSAHAASAPPTYQATTIDLSSSDTPVKYDEEYFRQITYTWTDSEGVDHESNLAEPATEYEQIVAFLREVYMNPNVPGFLEDPVKYNHDGDKDADDPNTLNTVQYKPCLAENNPYGMKEEDVIPTPIEGATAIIVELKDNYMFESGLTAEGYLRKIKEVYLLTNQIYVSGAYSATTNPGYLFNFVGMLDKFFIITKGNLRIAKNAEEGHPPFYNMFEEFSPSNKEPIYDAYQRMESGEKFPVDHNCTSIMSQNHIISMSAENMNWEEEDSEFDGYPMNFMFFLPDRRFSDDTRTSGIPNDQGKIEVYGWYTYYGEKNRPYFFFNDIQAELNEKPVYDNVTKTAKVKVEWESTYNDVVGFKASEQFYIYRVINDVIQENPIPLDEYEIVDSYYAGYNHWREEDGSIVTDKSRNQVFITEKQTELSYDIRYIIRGRRYPSDFELVESNIVNTRINGYAGMETLSINIDGRPKSTYDISSQRNCYENDVFLTDTPVDESMMLRRNHIVPASREGVDKGTVFTLRRYDGDNTIGSAKDIAYMEVIDEEVLGGAIDADTGLHTGWSVYKYTARITYPEGVDTTGLETTAEFKSARSYKDNIIDEDIQPITALDGHGGILAKFKDKFSASTINGEQPTSYHYYLMYESAVNISKDEKAPKTAYSNVVDVAVPVRNLLVGYVAYSEEDILSDMAHGERLPLNPEGIEFETRSNPYLTNYTVRRVKDNTRHVHVTRMPTGQLHIERRVRNNKGVETLQDYTIENHTKWTQVPVELDIQVDPGEEFVLILTYSNGNTYGNVFRRLHTRPNPVFNWYELLYKGEAEDGQYKYKARTGYEAENLEAPIDDEKSFYTVYGYRLWGKHDEQETHGLLAGLENDSQDEIPGEVNRTPRRALRRVATENQQIHEIEFVSHEATEDTPVGFDHHLRLYAQIPDNMSITNAEEGKGYIVSDATQGVQITALKDISTSIDGIPTEPGVFKYFDATGRELDPKDLPSGVILKVGEGKIVKIMN